MARGGGTSDEIERRAGRSVRRWLVLVTSIGVIGGWAYTGFYRLAPGEAAVVLSFGRYLRTEATAGLRWHVPRPIQSHAVIRLGELRREKFGYLDADRAALTEETAQLYKKGVYGNTMTTNPRGMDVACAVLASLTPELRANIVHRHVGIADDRMRPAGFVGGSLHPCDLVLEAFPGPVGLDVDSLLDAGILLILEELLNWIVAADRFVGAEDAWHHRSTQPGQIVPAPYVEV